MYTLYKGDIFTRYHENRLAFIVHECYSRMYRHSKPKGNFYKLVKEAEYVMGEKVIPFRDYKISEKKYERIFKFIIWKYRFDEDYARRLRLEVGLGCSPSFW